MERRTSQRFVAGGTSSFPARCGARVIMFRPPLRQTTQIRAKRQYLADHVLSAHSLCVFTHPMTLCSCALLMSHVRAHNNDKVTNLLFSSRLFFPLVFLLSSLFSSLLFVTPREKLVQERRGNSSRTHNTLRHTSRGCLNKKKSVDYIGMSKKEKVKATIDTMAMRRLLLRN